MIDDQGREIHGGPQWLSPAKIFTLNVFIDDEDDDSIYCADICSEASIDGQRYRFNKTLVTWVNNADGSSDVSMPAWMSISARVRTQGVSTYV